VKAGVEQHEGEEPQAYLLLASLILNWLAAQLAEAANSWLVEYLSATLFTTPPVFVTLLAELIKAIDENAALTQHNSSAKLHANAWTELASSLTQLTRSLMAGPLLGGSGQLSTHLLSILGLDPAGEEEEERKPWPLAVPPRRLAILAQVLMVRQAADTDAYSTRVTGLYIRLWERAVNQVMAAAAVEENNFEDLNIEHVQLLLMLFHALQLLQKKHVLLYTANQLIVLSNKSRQQQQQPSARHVLMVARLALLTDYMTRHLYEPPAGLLDHIQNNLFQQGGSNSGPPIYFPSPDHPEEEGGGEGSRRPRYYLLSPLAAPSSSMEVPKLDGLAVSFLLTSPEILDYAGLYEALMTSLTSINTLIETGDTRRRVVHYSFAVIWRLLHSLPPPAPVLAKLAAEGRRSEPLALGYGLSLHGVVLGLRSGNKAFATWMREGLVKQGLLLGKAESLVKAVSTDVNAVAFEMLQLQSCFCDIEAKLQQAAGNGLQLGDLLLLDCLIGKFQISLDKIFVTSSKFSSAPGLEGLLGLSSDLEALKAAAEWGGAGGGGSGGGSLAQAVEAAQQLVPGVARLVSQLSQAGRAMLLHRYQQQQEEASGGKAASAASSTLMHSLCLVGTRCQVSDPVLFLCLILGIATMLRPVL
jgi:E3 ubiquitin-protein ligase UBR4